jgi:putative drug exporter of the RND superfamily
VVVFGSFVFEDDRVLRMFGLGMAVAVLLDATVIRMLLVPATMELLGARNWWTPRWLDRLVPRLSAEGTAIAADAGERDSALSRDVAEAGTPAPDPQPVDA